MPTPARCITARWHRHAPGLSLEHPSLFIIHSEAVLSDAARLAGGSDDACAARKPRPLSGAAGAAGSHCVVCLRFPGADCRGVTFRAGFSSFVEREREREKEERGKEEREYEEREALL